MLRRAPTRSLALLGAVVALHVGATAQSPNAQDVEYFETEVRPVLADTCVRCHGPKRQRSGLRLDSGAAILAGGERGPAVVPGDPDGSPLIVAVRYADEDLAMPPKGKLDDEAIEVLVEWVRRGAPHPDEELREAALEVREFDLAERATHWSFQPLREVAPPSAPEGTSPIDAFVRARLAERGLMQAAPAAPATLLRRLSFDLTGLPPTPKGVLRSVAGDYEHEVERLLASPHFGERQARHWLDLMRYAESRGHEFDDDIPNAHQYRDYVIRAFNADVPYDDFVTEHLAGDLVDAPRLDPMSGANESVLGTGFWFLGSEMHSPVDIRGDETDRTANKVDVLSRAFLGLTVACARCHDHKFDPITAEDYYALSGFALGGSYRQVRFETTQANAALARELAVLDHEHSPEVVRALGAYLEGLAREVDEHLEAAATVVFANTPDDGFDGTVPAGQDLLFEDFERADYAPWTTTGTAFGDGPRTLANIPDYQEVTAFRGRYVVNSHNAQQAEDAAGADAHLGALTSPEFIVERDYIHFLIGGGSHDETAVRLVVDGAVVDTESGSDSNTLAPAFFDVRAWRGRTARLMVADEYGDGWGNVGFDHVVFSDRSDESALEVELSPQAAARHAYRIRTQAGRRGLAPEAVDEWAQLLVGAMDVEDRLLHPFAFLAATTGDLGPRDRRRQYEYTLAGLAARTAAGGLEPRVLAEYGSAGASTGWYPDGFGFGGGPRAAGEVVLDGASGGFDVVVGDGAHWDSTWDVLEVAPDSQSDPNEFDWNPAGRMLRTPTVVLESGRVFHLVRGAGHVFAVVDAHRMVKGPLHSRTTLSFDVTGDGFAFVEHDLRAYAGHRVHFEFSPARREGEPSAFALARVIETDERPTDPGLSAVLPLLAQGAPATLAALADGYERAFRGAARRLRSGETLEPGDTELLAWLARRAGRGPALPESYRAQRGELLARIQRVSRLAPAMLEGSGVDEFVLGRGNHQVPVDVAYRRFLEVFDGRERLVLEPGSGRLELARRLTDPDQPLLARVWANRVWHHLFGRGLVASVDDFGRMGEAPSHPELLDYLAHRLIESGWSTKALMREIVLSSTYRMSSDVDPRAAELDPINVFLHSAPRRRLDGESIRDAMLAVSGGLDTTLFGQPVAVHLTDYIQGRGRPEVSGPLDGDRRRSLYLAVRRNFMTPFFRVFDRPPPATTMGRRGTSNVPAQALTLLNDPFVLGEAERWAERLLSGGERSAEARVVEMYRSALGRAPDAVELAAATDFVTARATEDPARGWADLGHALFNVKEFVYLD
jgi:mono/diheme cytochrome c family protein